MPRGVWLAVALFGLVAALWSVAVPAYRAPDEPAHVDLVLYLAEGHAYPRFDGRYFGEEVDLDTQRHLIELQLPWPRFDAADAPPRSQRPDVDDLGGVGPDSEARKNDEHRAGYPYVYNQMPQHPPLYYTAMAGLLGAERWALPGDDRPGLDRELGLLRLANVLLVAPLPLLAWATVRRLGGSDVVGTVAAFLPFCVPQLTYSAASVNNDNLLILLGGVLTALLVGVARGARSPRTDLAVGGVLGLALLTKAFAVMFVPWVLLAYLLCLRTTGERRRSAVAALTALGVGAVLGSSWWLANWVRVGQPAPTTESLTRTAVDRPPGFSADGVVFLWTFTGRFTSRVWAWVGFGTPKFELPWFVVVVLTASVAGCVLVAVRKASSGVAVVADGDAGGPGGGTGLRRWDVLVAWLPIVLMTVFVARRAWGLYETTGRFAFIQGRYLFGSVVAPMAVVAFGVVGTLGRGRRALVSVLVVGAGLQSWMIAEVLRGSWTGDGLLGPLRGALAWSPWPPEVVVAVAVAAAAVAVAAGLTAVTPYRSPSPSSASPLPAAPPEPDPDRSPDAAASVPDDGPSPGGSGSGSVGPGDQVRAVNRTT